MTAVAQAAGSARASRAVVGALADNSSVVTMRAAVVRAPGRIDVVKTPVPQPNQNQLLVALEGCGVCASNIPTWEGKPWFTYPLQPGALGHEAWGRVAKAGSAVRNFKAGDRVAILSTNAYAEFDICDSAAA